MKKEVVQNFKVHRIAVSGNGININVYTTRKPQKKIYDASFVGRIHPSKGIHLLLYAWRKVTNELPQAKLIIVGGGLAGTVKLYENMVKQLGLENNVTFTGFIWKDEEIAKILRSSRIFVFPSLRESFGISVAEAMACGLPCIVSNIPALRETFNGLAVFVNPHNVNSFGKAILNLLEDANKRRILGHKGVGYVKKLSWEKVAQKEIETFRKIMHTSMVQQKRFKGVL